MSPAGQGLGGARRHYHLWFLRPQPEARTHHLQVIEHDELHARALIAFRDKRRAEFAPTTPG